MTGGDWRLVVSFVAIALVSVHSQEAVAEPLLITTCGQTVTGRAELAADLDCSTFPGDAVSIERGSLLLNGFTLTGSLLPGAYAAVACHRGCRVIGPGTITGGQTGGVVGDLLGPTVFVYVRDVTITGCTGTAAAAELLRARGVTATNNGAGLYGGATLRVRDSFVMDNLGIGAFTQGRVRIADSTVTGNAYDPAGCLVPGVCPDVASYRPPRVVRTVCGLSASISAPYAPWGVCQND
jgi:hypothetical protein